MRRTHPRYRRVLIVHCCRADSAATATLWPTLGLARGVGSIARTGLVRRHSNDLSALSVVVRGAQPTIAVAHFQRPQPLVNAAVGMLRRVSKPSQVVPQLVEAVPLLVHVQRRRLCLQQHEADDRSNSDEQKTPSRPQHRQPAAQDEHHDVEELDGRPPRRRALGSAAVRVGVHHIQFRTEPACG